MSKWLGFSALLVVVVAAAAPSISSASESCDLDKLKRYPMTDVIERRASRLEMPTLFFPDPKEKPEYSFEFRLDRAAEVKAKAALARGLQSFKPVEQPIAMLAAIASWTKAENGFINFFVGEPGVYIDEVLATLDSEGLKDHAMFIRQGRALFGSDYGTAGQRYDHWSDGHGTILDPILDTNLRALSTKFHALPNLVDEAEARINRSPDLKAIYEPLQASATDDDKLSYLTSGLINCLTDAMADNQEAALLTRLPASYARLVVVDLFNFEMLNGSVDQFFYNSSGDFAPEVVVALNAMGLKKHADAVQHGIDLFPKPYPTDTGKRRRFMSERGGALDNALGDLTSIVDDGRIDPAMIQFAKAKDVLPK